MEYHVTRKLFKFCFSVPLTDTYPRTKFHLSWTKKC